MELPLKVFGVFCLANINKPSREISRSVLGNGKDKTIEIKGISIINPVFTLV